MGATGTIHHCAQSSLFSRLRNVSSYKPDLFFSSQFEATDTFCSSNNLDQLRDFKLPPTSDMLHGILPVPSLALV